MRFLVIGDNMVDVYWSGSIRRLNPEKHSAPIVDIDKTVTYPGGAGNVAENLRALGVSVVPLYGDSYCQKNRVIDDDGVVCRFDRDGVSQPVLPDLKNQWFDSIIVSDYGKGSVTPKLADAVMSIGCPVFVDTKADPSPWMRAKCIFPNGVEYNRHRREYGEFKL